MYYFSIEYLRFCHVWLSLSIKTNQVNHPNVAKLQHKEYHGVLYQIYFLPVLEVHWFFAWK